MKNETAAQKQADLNILNFKTAAKCREIEDYLERIAAFIKERHEESAQNRIQNWCAHGDLCRIAEALESIVPITF
jgi:hypothetical protein